MTSDAVLDGPHPAGVGVHVSAEARRVLTGEHGIHEPQRRELRVQHVESNPGLYRDRVVLGVDLEDLGHPVERDHHAAVTGNCGPGEPGTRAASSYRCGLLGGDSHDCSDLGRRPWVDHDERDGRLDGKALVVGQVGMDVGAGGDMSGADRIDEGRNQIRFHTLFLPTPPNRRPAA